MNQLGEHSSTPAASSMSSLPQIEQNTGFDSAAEKDPRNQYFVDWDGPNDPSHPQNWSLGKRVWATFVLALLNLVFTIDSSIFGSGGKIIAEEFEVSSEVTILGVTLFLLVWAKLRTGK